MLLDGIITENDCCGNGCANCILDIKSPVTSHNIIKDGKKNILKLYTKFMLSEKCVHLDNVVELYFTSESNEKSFDFILDIPPGHHIMTRAPINDLTHVGNTKLLLRPYSPFWIDEVKLHFKILVNLNPDGPMSKFINSVNVGDEVEFRGPIGTYDIYEDKSDYILLITQGVAVAPSLRIIDTILNNEDDMRRIVHLCCFRDLNNVYFRRRLHEYNKYWNYRGRVYLAHRSCDNNICHSTQAEPCEHFSKCLWYKEQIVPKRLDLNELKYFYELNNCNTTTFIISGSREFQDRIKSMITIIPCIGDTKIYFL